MNYLFRKKLNIDFVKIIFSALCWVFIIFCIIWPLNYFMGVDAYYHIKIAEIMREHGLVLGNFSWADCSIWKDNFFDKDWLFHIYLIPFTFLGKLVGGKIAILGAVFIICISWGIFLKSLRIKNIFLALIIMMSCYGFYSRLFMCRGHLLSIAFFPLCLAAIINRKQALLFVLVVAYSLSYAGSWQILPLAFLFDLLMSFYYKDSFSLKQSATLVVLLALIISIFANPYFPNNINGLIIQNFFVLKAKWFGTGNIVLNLGNEFNSLTVKKVCEWYLLFFVLLFITLGNFFKIWKKQNLNTVYLGILTIIYFLLTIISMKFSDYSVPLGFVFIALFWDKWLTRRSKESVKNKLIFYFFYFSILLIVCLTMKHYMRLAAKYDKPLYSDAIKWLNDNLLDAEIDREINPKQVIFTGGWDDAPMLFYGAPQYKYLVFLDPSFMYFYSSRKYLIWQKIVKGKIICPAVVIHKEFNANLVFVDNRRKILGEILEQDPYAELCYSGSDGEKIFKITPPRPQKKSTDL
jgi:hypothetical protein